MTTPERTEPSTTAGERDMLEGWLDYHRGTLEVKCAGLNDEQLRQLSVPPSEISLLGLVRHMAEVERGWFRNILAGEGAEYLYSNDDRDGDFHVTEQDTYAEAYATWQAEIARARELAASRTLDDVGTGKHRSGETFNLRWIMTHMIEEYARHNGHADLVRERIDGATGE
ncbi:MULTISPECIES: DinB family protein [unclassified Streptomyces]|uniref:DinB family protein n=1 Tax=unclassified Streptomyces TaxID=2593676 RepID=UPI002DDA07A6|nr:DinB family protein [Streptomyces sp. NBC_01750]WSB04124.1 DinB family protein [Streptomyces sp. NBC_01794]WSD31591.1 DinB family protein [Streptomyces sp. NBC_01750]